MRVLPICLHYQDYARNSDMLDIWIRNKGTNQHGVHESAEFA